MPRTTWHIQRDAKAITLCRHIPARFDVSASTTLPHGSGTRLAHQIRQDMWRALQSVRGFSPTVHLQASGAGWDVTAGGRLMGPPAESMTQRIADVLSNPENRARWVRLARKGKG